MSVNLKTNFRDWERIIVGTHGIHHLEDYAETEAYLQAIRMAVKEHCRTCDYHAFADLLSEPSTEGETP